MGNRILLVDSDDALLEALPDTLALWLPGVMVDTYATVGEAWGRIACTDYDVIICESQLPGNSGLTLLAHARRVRPMTPVIVFTGHGEPTLARRAFEAGAYDFLVKPIDRHVLLLSVMRAMEAHRFRSRFDSEARRWLSESRRYRLHQHA